ncbi:putative alpha-glucosidase II precursor [Testicularia cyperi]|uniref:Glucosidase II subunit alpha n=1 Tax=Testicularia cyperi TaxID=1882483 RepID=A0A317XRN1_9BASI|nr:putative alpha-glucosidase II precursor [Testicularia cyperi]
MSLPSLARPCLALLLFLFLAHTAAVRPNDFKKCKDSSFCRRIRRQSSYVEEWEQSNSKPFVSPYFVPPHAPSFDHARARLVLPLESALHPHVQFELAFTFFQDGTARVQADQVGQRYKNWKRYDQASVWAIDQMPALASSPQDTILSSDDRGVQVDFGPAHARSLKITYSPLKIEVLRDGEVQVVLNDRGLMHLEHFRPKPDPFPTPNEDDYESHQLVFQRNKRSILNSTRAFNYDDSLVSQWAGFEKEDDGEWEETWASRRDSKPKGPEALALDMTFPGYSHLFGLPEHASPLSLRSTRAPLGRSTEADEPNRFQDPYRLMNTDVFEYEHDSPMSLYGSVPVLHAQSKDRAVSVFWLSGSETWIDLHKSKAQAKPTDQVTSYSHFFSESGILDLFIFTSSNAQTNMALFSKLVGRTVLPQYFAIGYHQCRWNYLTDSDVKDVSQRFDDEDIPMDVMWLDIEYSKDHMYGVWDEKAFKDPEGMVQALDQRGRKLVIIIDPHLKRTRDYYLYAEAHDKKLLVKDSDAKGEYEGWCWSGSASWLDMFEPASWKWWADQFSLSGNKLTGKLRANARNVHVWNDMNEPAIFNGPEITSPKDVIHAGGWEHRDLHNINGVLFHNQTARGLRDRELGVPTSLGGGKARRPFVLSRAWWVGTQKYGAIWTGDNLGTWEHLAVSVPMILANNVGGMSFCGADVGGFFGNPSPDMLVRWYQAGIFEPFFRAHAHIDTKRREPYLLEEPLRSAVRSLLKLRYQMLPMWYTAFKANAVTGLPVLRPQYLMFPGDVSGFAVDTQYYVGDSGLLVRPAVEKDVDSVSVYLAEDRPYYNYFTHEVYHGSASGKTVTVPAPLTEQMPLLHRGGSILPLRERPRRAAELGRTDPFTLVVALNKAAEREGASIRAEGTLYLDDGQTYDYEKGEFVWRRFEWSSDARGSTHVLRSVDESAVKQKDSTVIVGDAKQLQQYSSDNAFAQSIKHVRVEKLIILGLDKEPGAIRINGARIQSSGSGGQEVSWTWKSGAGAGDRPSSFKLGAATASELVVKDPAVSIVSDWSIDFE